MNLHWIGNGLIWFGAHEIIGYFKFVIASTSFWQTLAYCSIHNQHGEICLAGFAWKIMDISEQSSLLKFTYTSFTTTNLKSQIENWERLLVKDFMQTALSYTNFEVYHVYVSHFTTQFMAQSIKAFHFRCASFQLLYKFQICPETMCVIISTAARWSVRHCRSVVCLCEEFSSPLVITHESRASAERKRSSVASCHLTPHFHRLWSNTRTTNGNTKAMLIFSSSPQAVRLYFFSSAFRLPSRVLHNIQSKLFVERGIA